MQLSIHPSKTNPYPILGVLLRGNSPAGWLRSLAKIGISLKDCKVFPVPGNEPNSVFGCVVLCQAEVRNLEIDDNAFLQLVQGKLFIPTFADVFPKTHPSEWETLLEGKLGFFHPITGLCLLEAEMDWKRAMRLPERYSPRITQPEKGAVFPDFIATILVEPDPESLALEDPFKDVKEEKLPFNLEKLMKGNDREVEKFLKFLEKNPELALSLGIPLDTLGASRGAKDGKFTFGRTGSGGGFGAFGQVGCAIALVFGLFLLFAVVRTGPNAFSGIGIVAAVIIFLFRMFNSGSVTSGGGVGSTSLLNAARFNQLQRKYEELAKRYEDAGDYRKAAHIYRKLLKNPYRAAETLEKGGHFQEAAEIYLKVCNMKAEAAKAYEKGNMYREAIAIYSELNDIEKVADLYMLLNHKEKAYAFYTQKADEHIKSRQYVKASLVYSEKMGDRTSAQAYLMEGWREHADAENCLNLYLRNLRQEAGYSNELSRIFEHEVPDAKVGAFLRVIKKEYSEVEVARDKVRDMAFELISTHGKSDPSLVSELIHFSTEKKMVLKDVMRYKLGRRSGMRE